MTLDPNGTGTVSRAGKTEPMLRPIWNEENSQFGIYRQLQLAHARAGTLARQGVTLFSVPGPVRTWFRVDKSGRIVGALNSVPTDKGTIDQTFAFDGFWSDDGAIFPKHMEMRRGGEPYFKLDVEVFDARN